jgi:hypothetical protein
MKKLQNLCAACALLFVLSVSVPAGNIHTDFVPPPPPPPPASAMAAEPVESGTVVTQATVESDSLVTKITLSLLQLLSVF